MKTKIVIILALVLIAITFLKMNFLSETTEYKVFDENNKAINAQIFLNDKTVKGEQTKELILYFPEMPRQHFLTVAIPPKLIGIPDNAGEIKVYFNKLYLPNESKIFMPINEGVEKILDTYFVSDTLIYFNTFDDFKKYGGKIIVKK